MQASPPVTTLIAGVNHVRHEARLDVAQFRAAGHDQGEDAAQASP